ncbi:site-specific DNA-methyltransferase [uncultured Paraglaciecola sp.]|uniref:DNA-methyltransferase n=1 Tax=uncultured Paraglaciecola sp. TaxID=1765024 RepID=UPI00260DA6A4|nr:site-specific DNA-methyltransferase [uncultured Paraglaciecola sp.]
MSAEFLNIDCREYMREQADGAFDIAITSPPYNMNLRVRNGEYCSRQIVKELSTKYERYADNLPMDEYRQFITEVALELARVSTIAFFNIQMITGNKPALFKMLGDCAEIIKELIVWDKGPAQPAIGENTLNSRYELIVVLSKQAKTRQFTECNFERGTLDNIWQIGKNVSATGSHRAGFPVALTDRILSNFSKAGDMVFDPFLGTGTTAISAHKHNCSFVGCEIDMEYCEIAKTRFRNETAQMVLY